ACAGPVCRVMAGTMDFNDVSDRRAIDEILKRCWEEGEGCAPPQFWVRRARADGAEYSSNIALISGNALRSPAEIAGELRRRIEASHEWPGRVEELRGFLNFYLND